MTVLVIAECDHDTASAATASTIAAARMLGDPVHVLIAGADCCRAAKRVARLAGVSAVKYSEAPYYADQLPENLTALIIENLADVTHIVAPANSFGRRLLPRVAAQLNVSQLSDITAIEAVDTFVRPIYSGNVLETVATCDRIKVLTIRPSAFEPVQEGAAARVEAIAPAADKSMSKLLSKQLLSRDQPDLSNAAVIVSGGRALRTPEQFNALLSPLANALGAAIGASRAAVDAGFVSNAQQVGETGRIVSPELYIAVGISGAMQHLAGIMESKIIVAINNDPDAPIFGIADYGLVGDLFEIVPQLTERLSKKSAT